MGNQEASERALSLEHFVAQVTGKMPRTATEGQVLLLRLLCSPQPQMNDIFSMSVIILKGL